MTNSESNLVDVHAHFLPPGYVEAAVVAGHTTPDGMPSWPAWSPEQHLRLMDAAGIETSVLSLSSPGVHFGNDGRARALAVEVNDFAAELCARHPDRFRFFASLPLPALDAAIDELERACDDLGAVGVVLESNAGGVYPSDPVLEPLWRHLDARRTTVFLHPTSPPGWERTSLGLPRPLLEFLVETTRAVVGLLDRGVLRAFPGVQVIVPHCGALLPAVLDRLELFATAGVSPARGESPAATVTRLWFDLAGTPMPANARVLVDRVGTDRLLFGSDYCFTPDELVRRQIESLDLGRPGGEGMSWRDLTRRNALSLLGRTARTPAG